MKQYNINEIFYSLQGEGHYTGKPAVFIRFSGCNLACPFCDTDFRAHKLVSLDMLVADALNISQGCRFVVLTGGEPTLQVDRDLVEAFHAAGFYLAIETNGTHRIPQGIDWVTCSPKIIYIPTAHYFIDRYDEIKIVYDGVIKIDRYADMGRDVEKWIQPCDTGNPERNTEIIAECVEWCKAHPDWRLSLQTQKILKVR